MRICTTIPHCRARVNFGRRNYTAIVPVTSLFSPIRLWGGAMRCQAYRAVTAQGAVPISDAPYFVLTINVPGDFVNPCSTDDANPAPSNIFEYSAKV
jgi:hypothetical protein